MLTILFHMVILLVPLLIVFGSQWIFIVVCLVAVFIISIFIIYDTLVRLTMFKLYL